MSVRAIIDSAGKRVSMKQQTGLIALWRFVLKSLLLLFLPCLQAGESVADELQLIKALFDKPDPVVWILTGDSITHGALHTHGHRSYPEHFAERVRWEMGRVRDVVINTGISGDTVPGLIKDLDHRVLQFRPAVVSIMMGMNDAHAGPEGREAFREAYIKLVSRLKDEASVLILLHTPNPVTTRRSDLPAYAQIIREVARDRGVALCDQDKIWRDHITGRKSNLNYLLNDGTIHPNGPGHVLFAHSLCKTLGIHDPASNTGRLYVP